MSGALRVGQGFDTHRFGAGDHIMLGGVRIVHERGVVAHSDGDVLLHALTDALLGAAGLGDLGHHFPDTDPRWAGAAGLDLLGNVMQKLTVAGWRVGNADCTLVAEAPRLAPHLPAMRANVAAALEVDETRVSLKATTAETMGFIGRGEGIAALAVVLLTGAVGDA
ncbi:MAG: 2-C-methyl-D-erythritol 2,4-cyclodiphosphate synthase [Gammaproteobacteria bacterium]